MKHYTRVEKLDLAKVLMQVEEQAKATRKEVVLGTRKEARKKFEYIYTLLQDLANVI